MTLSSRSRRMPEVTGVEFLAQVFERHPSTVRIILTGFADMDATIGAINDGHVYAYVTKPWEPDELKRVVRRAVEHHELASENERLVSELKLNIPPDIVAMMAAEVAAGERAVSDFSSRSRKTSRSRFDPKDLDRTVTPTSTHGVGPRLPIVTPRPMFTSMIRTGSNARARSW